MTNMSILINIIWLKFEGFIFVLSSQIDIHDYIDIENKKQKTKEFISFDFDELLK